MFYQHVVPAVLVILQCNRIKGATEPHTRVHFAGYTWLHGIHVKLLEWNTWVIFGFCVCCGSEYVTRMYSTYLFLMLLIIYPSFERMNIFCLALTMLLFLTLRTVCIVITSVYNFCFLVNCKYLDNSWSKWLLITKSKLNFVF